ncbi:AzlC family ABC transporter permease [Burkholderia gladioli]|uniref:AzlC family ABC transporter permease n=1 Tax=Burkholderia gladioli TaxID=28095 RepID=A0AB38TRU4_BURGA|nr:AzlC family ABC transporter permease [Burkholderia gladioli]MBU9179522.1 AzlC family ABC transporter permease [Burkholderia gladioli]MBU9191269.1 AzlC family ABC transporter permease [Burkholderia gladioli]MBU9276971.1 AzlC family ABC transporter permease [Burkholderia gladioli]MCA8168288.1 AzlC family ABC transporter permease [Burkholderia gladioli]PRE26108.1 branched-chain amino acid ABC transporter permease [Burkholderia gladioli]
MLARLSASDRFSFVQGARDYAPTLTAMLSWGLVTGIAMSKSVLTTNQAVWMSLLVYGGSSQLAVLPLLAAKLPLWTLLLTAAMVNLRFVIFSAGMAPHFSHLPMWRRALIGYFNGDVIYLLFIRQGFANGHVPGKEAYFWGMAIVSWLSWQASSLAGIALASVVPDQWGLGLAGTLALIPIMVSAVANRSTLVAVVVAGIVALLAIELPYRLGLPLAVLAALAAGTLADVFIERSDWRRLRAEVRPRDALDASEAGRDGEGGAR